MSVVMTVQALQRGEVYEEQIRTLANCLKDVRTMYVLCLVRLGQLLAQIHLPCCLAFYCSMYFTLCFALRIK